MESRLYSQGEVYKIFKHISPSTLLFWARRGLMESVKEATDGRGKHRFFSLENLHQLAAVEELTTLNFSLEIIGSLVKGGFVKMDSFLAIEKQVPGREGMEYRKGIYMFFNLPLPTKEEENKYQGYLCTGTFSTVIINLPALAERVEELIKAAGV